MALYRTYRPATFAEVVGQEHVTEPLSRALDSGRINHAYLFSGPRGCGKTSSARILARSLNCEQGPTSTPCGTCASCVALAPGGTGDLDVMELDAASHGGVDDARELRDRAFYSPAQSRYRVLIVDEAHMVTNAGFNALLKIVEEPPEHLIFIFATTEPEKVLATIRSRTHHYPFRLLPPAVMRGLLESICEREGARVEPAVFPLVIRAGAGSPRDSLSVLDQLLAGADDGGVTYDRALGLLGVTDVALIDDAVGALAAADGRTLFQTVERVIDAGHEPRRFAGDLLDRLRDLIVLQNVPDAAERGVITAPGEQLAAMAEQARALGAATTVRLAETVHAALGEMRGTTSPRLLLEVMCARMLLPETSSGDAALLQRIEMLEKAVAGGVVAPGRGAVESGAPPAGGAGGAAGAAAGEQSRFVRRSQQASDAVPAVPAPMVPAPTVPGPAAAVPTRVEPPSASAESTPAAPKPAAVSEPPPWDTAEPPSPAGARAPEPGSDRPSSRPATPVARPVESPASRPPEPEAVRAPEPAAPEPAPVAPAPAPPAPVRAAGPDVAAVRTAWSEVRAKVRELDKVVEVMLSGATVVAVEGETLVLAHTAPPLAQRLSSDRGTGVLRRAVKETLGVDWNVVCRVGEAGGPPGPPEGRRPSRQAASPPAAQPTFTRPSRAGAQAPVDIPPPYDEPPPEDMPPPPVPDDELSESDRAEMMDDDSAGDEAARRDPVEAAMELLVTHLGAKPLRE